MDKKDLQIFAGLIVTESKLPKQAKIQMLEWIQHEASKIDLMGFLMDGRIKHFDENVEQVVIDRFSVHEAGGRVAKIRKSYMSTAGGAGGLNLMWLAYRKVRSMYDACTRRCGKYETNTSRRQHCMIKCKVSHLEGKLAAAKKAKNDGEVQKASAALQKAKAALLKSKASFASRGAEE